MPKTTDPNIVKVGTGSSSCNDHAKGNISTQILINQDAYDASQISAENPFETYLGDEAQSHFDDLASQVRHKPPRLGEGSKTYSFGSLSATHSGFPDWGMLKQADSKIWDRKSAIEFDGITITDTSTHFLLPASDTFGYNLTTPTPSGSGDGSDPRTDSTFNALDNNVPVTLLGAGEGASFLSSVQKDNNRQHQHSRVIPRDDANLTELASAKEGFTVSGLLFPADRGTVAILRWEDGDTTNLSYTQASSIDDIKSRVVAAVNLNGGLEETDVSIFTEGTDQFAFPSKLTGQYDLGELQSGNLRDDLGNGGVSISGLTAGGSSLGSVRLLRQGNASYFGDGVDTVDTVKGHLPVLGGGYSWNGAIWAETKSKNFLSYRMPVLADYSPSGIKTPTSERERFFSILQPSSLTGEFDTAGNYITFGDDYYTFQVARFRHVVDYSLLEPAVDDTQYRKGSYALVHFKTEDAFENLVRDGIQPSEDDLWSVNFLDALEVEHIDNAVVDADGFSDKGKAQVESPIGSVSNPLTRPTVRVVERDTENWFNSNQDTFSYTSLFPDDINNDNKFEASRGYFTIVSGVKYMLPRASVPVQRRVNNNSPYRRNNVAFDVLISGFSSGLYSSLGSALNYSHYFNNETGSSSERKFNEPFDQGQILLGSFTSGNTLKVYMDNATEDYKRDSTNQFITLKNGDKVNVINESVSSSSDLFGCDFLIYPQGDTGLCTFSEIALPGYAFKDPTYHYDGLGTSKVIKPNRTDFGAMTETTRRFLYHSSKLFSLIANSATRTVRIYVDYDATASGTGKWFSIFRYDQEGFRIYQTLTINEANIQEVSELHSNETTYPTLNYPKYGPTNTTNTASAGLHEATLEMVVDEPYYIEYGTNSNGVNLFRVMFVDGGDVGAGSESDALATKRSNNPAGNQLFNLPTGWDRLGAGGNWKLTYAKTNILGVTTHSGTMPYPAFQPDAFNVNSYDLHEIPSDHSESGDLPEYGNFVQGRSGIIGVTPLAKDGSVTAPIPHSYVQAYDPLVVPLERRVYQGLLTARKDTQERFLDESYRIEYRFLDITGKDNLVGAGLPDGSNIIDLSVRDDSSYNSGSGSKHGSAGYLRNNYHYQWANYSGESGVEGNAQVRGMPCLANNILSGGKFGQPRRGVLTLPSQNYNNADAYVPNESYDSGWVNSNNLNSYTAGQKNSYYEQPDYTSHANGYLERPYSFVRVFDVSFSRSSSPENMAGTSRFKLRLVGLDLDTFKYTGNDRRIEIYIKVPGLTCWLDVGRMNNTGSSKQHLNQDGAGCLISSQEGLLVDEAIYFTDVELEVGANASFFTNSDGECPVLVKAVIPYNLVATDGTLNFGLPPSNMATNTPLRQRRGLIGIEILRMSNGKNFDEDVVHYF